MNGLRGRGGCILAHQNNGRATEGDDERDAQINGRANERKRAGRILAHAGERRNGGVIMRARACDTVQCINDSSQSVHSAWRV